jgi:TonB family protein
MNALSDSLLDVWLALAGHLWQTSLVLGLLLLLSRALGRAPAGFVYSLWVLGLAKLFLPLSLIGGWAGSLILQLVPGIGLARRAAGSSILVMVGSVVDPGSSLGRRAGPTDPLGGTLLFLLTAAWIGGVCLLVCRFLRSWRRPERVNTSVPPNAGDPVASKLDRALLGTDIPRRKIVIGPAGTVPYVTGLLYPSIHLARDLVEALGPEELRAVLTHEEAHRRRREPLRLALLGLASALFFFYPLVYLLRRRIQEAAELVCDETVVRRGTRPEVYARALAATIRLGLAPAPSPVAAGVHSGAFLHARFERIQTWKRSVKMPRHYLTMAAAILLVAAGSLLPVQLLTGCSKGRGVPASVAQSFAPQEAPQEARQDAVVPATPTVDTARPLQADRPSPDTFVKVDEMPVMITPPRPVFPEKARSQAIEGVVTTRALVGRDGKVSECFAVDGPDLLREAALKAVEAATFKPAQQGGQPIAVWVQIPIRFSLH